MIDDGEPRVALIAGAGPAGLTAGLELLQRSNFTTTIFEVSAQPGGISKTINHHGNRMDLGGHRFFSKSDWVMRWWQEILPIDAAQQGTATEPIIINYQNKARVLIPLETSAQSQDRVMLIRRRMSRIFYLGKFFDYPLTLNAVTLKKLGFLEVVRIALSYVLAQLLPRIPELTLSDFLINRFGHRLYLTFFKDYTEKVWGVACEKISAEWGAQRIKGLSVLKVIENAIRRRFPIPHTGGPVPVETSLIEHFLYPKYGPGQLWEEVARRIEVKGGDVEFQTKVIGIEHANGTVTAVNVVDLVTLSVRRIACDFFISTMPVRDLIGLLKPDDACVARVAETLPYRDFITVGLLVRQMQPTAGQTALGPRNGMLPDTWIYIQEPGVKIGRLQIFNNWSPAMVSDEENIWLGLEYFCNQDDDLWAMNDAAFIDFAAGELEKIGLVDRKDVIDGTLVRVPKAYPAYFGAYEEFESIRKYLDQFSNLYPIGRNGMHRYNNQDHSMLTAKAAVDSILNGGTGKSEIWGINADTDYHESISSVDLDLQKPGPS